MYMTWDRCEFCKRIFVVVFVVVFLVSILIQEKIIRKQSRKQQQQQNDIIFLKINLPVVTKISGKKSVMRHVEL